MKKYSLLTAISILVLFIFITGCAKGPLITKKRAQPPERKKVEQPVTSPITGPPEVKPPSIVSPDVSVNPNAVGCLFPLTGRFGNAGRRALDAALLSAEIFKQRSKSPWEIVVADSGETPQKTKEAVSYLADGAKVLAIVAMSGTAEATVIAQEAQKRQVPLILIASKEGVTEVGEYVFQHFLTPTQQMEALTRYAFNTLNVAIYSVLYPQDDYGEEMVSLFRGKVKNTGGRVNQAIPYSKTQTDFSEQIRKLTGKRVGASEKVYAAAEEAQNRSSVEFEALFIPDSHPRVKMVASQLAYHGVRGVKLLGTSLWHSPDLVKKDAESLEGAVFVDSFFVNGLLPETNDFVDIYYSKYSREPGNIDALSYDSIGIVLDVLEKHQIKTRVEFLEALLAVQGFRGATGSISFHGHRVAQKDAFILKVQNGKIEQVK